MQTLKIDEELKALIPPLRESEYSQLEENILSEGIREPIIVWNGTIIDGHNRYAIAQKHGLDFTVKEMQFDSKDAVISWMIYNQFGRRNLSAYDRSLLALKLKPFIAARAKERQIESGGAVLQKSAKPPIDTRQEIAKAAGVSHDTIAKVEKIEQLATAEIKNALKTGELSINAAYKKLNSKKESHVRKNRGIDARKAKNGTPVEEMSVRQLQAAIAVLKTELAKAQDESKGWRESFDRSQDEIAAWKDTVANLESRIEYQEERANNAVANYEKTDKKNGLLLAENADLQESLDIANADIAKLTKQLENSKTVIKEVPPADYADLQREVQELRDRPKEI